MSAILIYRTLSDTEVNFVSHKAAEGARVFLAADMEPSVKLDGLELGSIVLDESKKNDANYGIVQDLLSFGDKEVNGKAIRDHLSIGHRSIWYYHKYRIFFTMRDRRYRALEIEQYASEYENLDVFTEQASQESTPSIQIHYKMSTSSLNLNTVFTFVTAFFSRCVAGWLQSLHLSKGKKHVIISTPKAVGPYIDLESLQTVPDDLYLGYLMQGAKDEFLFLDNMHVPKFKSRETYKVDSGHSTNIEGRERLYGEYILLRGWLSSKIRKERKQHALHLAAAYSTLQNQELTETHRQILSLVVGLDQTSKLFSLKYLSFRAFFNSKSYKTITAQDETAAWTKLILDAGKDENLSTIGVQHGAINDLNIAYLFTKGDHETPPIPDKTLVWGQHWKNMATTYGNYPNDSVIPVGQIRTDIIPKLEEARYNIFERSIPKEHAILVFATQPQPDKALMRRATIDTFNAVKKMTNLTLVIKMHPRERDPKYYHLIARDVGCENYLVDNTTDLYRVISSCDLMMTCYSVVGGEGVYFNKPLIILDHLKLDYCNFHEEGVAKQATSSEELQSFISQFLNGSLQIDTDRYEAFKSKYAYKIDGKVVERCLEVIRNCE